MTAFCLTAAASTRRSPAIRIRSGPLGTSCTHNMCPIIIRPARWQARSTIEPEKVPMHEKAKSQDLPSGLILALPIAAFEETSNLVIISGATEVPPTLSFVMHRSLREQTKSFLARHHPRAPSCGVATIRATESPPPVAIDLPWPAAMGKSGSGRRRSSRGSLLSEGSLEDWGKT